MYRPQTGFGVECGGGDVGIGENEAGLRGRFGGASPLFLFVANTQWGPGYLASVPQLDKTIDSWKYHPPSWDASNLQICRRSLLMESPVSRIGLTELYEPEEGPSVE